MELFCYLCTHKMDFNCPSKSRVFYDDGYKKGQVEGADKNNRDIAQKMKAKGFAVEDIAEITGLTIEVINSL